LPTERCSHPCLTTSPPVPACKRKKNKHCADLGYS
jgi:hypothetical protein